MIARSSQRYTTEAWNGLWGADARFYARRSDGACFVIEGDVGVFDLASSLPEDLATQVKTLPQFGRYSLRMFVAKPRVATTDSPAAESESDDRPQEARASLFACGVRRRMLR